MLTHSIHYCCKCKTYFNIDTTDIADPGSHYTKQVVDLAMRLITEDGSPYRDASWRLWRDHRVFVPFATIQNWVEEAGKKHTRTLKPMNTLTGPSKTFPVINQRFRHDDNKP